MKMENGSVGKWGRSEKGVQITHRERRLNRSLDRSGSDRIGVDRTGSELGSDRIGGGVDWIGAGFDGFEWIGAGFDWIGAAIDGFDWCLCVWELVCGESRACACACACAWWAQSARWEAWAVRAERKVRRELWEQSAVRAELRLVRAERGEAWACACAWWEQSAVRLVRVRAELRLCFRKMFEAKITTETNFSRYLLLFRSNWNCFQFDRIFQRTQTSNFPEINFRKSNSVDSNAALNYAIRFNDSSYSTIRNFTNWTKWNSPLISLYF